MLKALEERQRQREQFVEMGRRYAEKLRDSIVVVDDLGLAHTNQLKEVRQYGS